MALPSVSYDQLLMQVEALKMENSNLRQELEDNSNHLTKLESEASSMKEVLKQLQSSVKGDTLEMAAAATPEALLDRLKDLEGVCRGGVKLRSKVVLCSNGGGGDGSPLSSRSGDSSPIAGGGGGGGSSSSTASAGTTGAGGHKPRSCLNGSRRSAGYLEELEKERSLLLAEIEREEREKDWYYAQLQNLTKRIDGLPLTDGHYLQTDVTRRELELEAQNIRTAMEERLGTCQQMAQRAQVDVLRIKEIDQEIARVRQLLHEAQGVGSDGESSGGQEHDVGSVMSFSSTCSLPRQPASHLGTKVEMVYSLLSMLGTHDKDDMSRTLLAMSSSQDSCIAMRQSGCLPLLIQLLHGNNKDSSLLGAAKGNREARARASAALHNIVHSQPDDKRGHREMRVLHLLEQIRAYCEACWEWQDGREAAGGVGAAASAIAADVSSVGKPSPVENQIGPAICVLMKLSFDEDHRHAMNELGGLQAIAELLQADCEMFAMTSDQYNVTLRRYAGMALTNLTFGDVANKATLCSMRGCMRGMVAQLKADSEDLRQVIASVLRNLSWRADVTSKKILREVGSVSALTKCALEVKKESTLKSVLSALWNLSAHCTENKADICAVVGALGFLVDTLAYRSQTNTLAIIESGGGILRNVSSLIATNEDYRQILREHNCLQTLLQHLKSHSLTIVSNACGTLWNLSARNARDQEALWDMGAVAMLKNLIHSKHKMIAMGSAAALRNLMANRPAKYKDANILSPDSGMPTLAVRKQRALEAELDAQNLTETFDNIDNLSPKAQHRSKSAHKPQRHGLVSEYVLDGGGGGGRKNGVNVCRADAAAGGGGEPVALSPFVNSPLLHGHHHHNLYPKERHHLPADGAKGESPALGAEREPRAADAYRVGGAMEAVPDVSKHSRVAWAIEDAAAAAGSSASSVDGARSLSSDGRGGGTSYPQPNAPGYGKADGQSRGFQYHYGGVEFKAAHRDGGRAGGKTAHSKGASGKAPSDSAAFEKEKGKYHSYGKYPPDLAQKIHSANHLDENDSETDTPINYSLKYSDEQLNSGRQSPSRGSDVWVRQKQEAESGDKQSAEEKGLAGQFPGYCKRPQYAPQHEAAAHFYPMRPGGGGDGGGKREPPVERRINAADCQDDDYEDDKPTNYSERYSEEENQEEEEEAEAAALGGYRMKLPEKGRVRDEPIDYSLKYPAEYGPTGHKLFMGVKKMSAEKESAHVAGKPANVRVGKLAARDGNAAAGGAGEPGLYANRQAASGDKMQTFCLEGTPICFSRCSSLSSLSSADDGMETSHHPPSGKSGAGRADIRIVDLAEDGAGAGEEESPEPSPAARRAKAARHQGEGAHHKTVDFSGAKSPSKSGSQTPKSPLDHYVQETPLVFSRCSSVSSLDSYPDSSIASSIQSDPVSGTVSGVISPSELPDSPGQTMPPSRSKTPPPPRLRSERPDDEDEGREGPGEGGAKPDGGRQPWRGKADAGAQGTQSRDSLLHFETEATPDGFSCASSLSALSMDEPPIAKDAELRGAALAAVVEEAAAEAASPEAAQNSATPAERARRGRRAEESGSAEALEDSEDDSNILEECINSAMPTKSTAAKQKKDAAAAPSHKALGAKGRTAAAAAPKKPSQLPLYQARGGTRLPVQAPKHVSFTSEIFNRDVPNVYCTEGTPINFSTATSLSDLTFDSPPNEATGEVGAGGDAAEQRDAVPTEGRSNDEEEGGRAAAGTPGAGGAKPSENDILAECISSAMPKGKSHKPHRVKKIMDQMQQGPAAGGESAKSKLPSLRSAAQGRLLLQPTPANDSLETYRTEGTPVNFSAATSLGDLTADDTAERRDGGEAAPAPARRPPARHEARGGGHRGPPAAAREERPRPGFSSDSPLHFTPIEGTPYCFSRNDSLSSLDFEDDETDLAGDKAGLETDGAATDAPSGGARGPGKKSGEASAVGRGGGYHKGPKSGPPAAKGVHKPAAIPEEGQKPGTKLPKGLPKLVPTSQLPRAEKNADKRGSGLEEQVQRFAVEDTPVSFSRNSSLSSLSDIDRDNNNRGGARTAGGGEGAGATERPPARAKAAEPSAYAPRAFRVEDTPVCFSRNSSLSSLSVDSEDDLLQECISSAMPQRRKQQRTRKAEAKEQGAAGDDGGAPPDPFVRRLRARGQEAAVRDHGPGTVEPERDGGAAAVNREGGVPVERFDSPGSEKIGSPDSESFDWKAIQEGANSIVSSLNQAAACLSRRASSDSDSILSLVSGLSLGSPLHMTPEHENKSLSGGRGGGPRIVKAAEKGGGGGGGEWRKGDEEAVPKAVKGGKKVYRSGITGKARPSSDSAVPCLSRPAQPPAAVVPIVTRGRATAPSPGLRNPSPTASPAPKKPVAKTPVGSKSPASARAPAGTSRSISAPARSDMSSAARPSLSLGPVTPKAVGSRLEQLASARSLQSPARKSLSPGRASMSPGRNSFPSGRNGARGAAAGGRSGQTSAGTSSPNAPSSRSSSSGNLACLPTSGNLSCLPSSRSLGSSTPPRQITPPKAGGAAVAAGSRVDGNGAVGRPEPAGARGSPGAKMVAQTSGRSGGIPAKRAELARMSSTRSSESESERSDKPALVRQSTFIKETPSPDLRKKLKESASCESVSGLPELSPNSERGLEGRGGGAGLAEERAGNGARARPSRSQSRSPTRVPTGRSGTWKREGSKHSSSLPRVGTWRRVGSSSSILSASSESSDKTRSEDVKPRQGAAVFKALGGGGGGGGGAKGHPPNGGKGRPDKLHPNAQAGQAATEKRSNALQSGQRLTTDRASKTGPVHGTGISDGPSGGESGHRSRGTWRKLRDAADVSASPPPPQQQQNVDAHANHEPALRMAPAVSKTEDVWVRIEDCPINNPRSSKSASGSDGAATSPDKTSQSGLDDFSEGGTCSRDASTLSLNHEADGGGGGDAERERERPPSAGQQSPELESQPTLSEKTPFSSNSSSKHSSPSGAVSVRVTPFNYVPSPRKSSADASSGAVVVGGGAGSGGGVVVAAARPSQIPTPVVGKRHEEPKAEGGGGGGDADDANTKLHSGSYLVTSV
ncbi:adenomatous polyposis coli protein-like isoform X2 [Lethenteron reissneri]|uniref:adenomatous polyposis coli protein-like isoform X2 n=1 Tax=Lethenteron reissneri TaxID=7753 RepID=UPI002AB7990F|nr:adenomatous polyposis coli protein-like isoform X2 [Lethenteron reissneri]